MRGRWVALGALALACAACGSAAGGTAQGNARAATASLPFEPETTLSSAQHAQLLTLLTARVHAVNRDASVAEDGGSFVVRFPPASRALILAVATRGVLENREELGALPVGQSIPASTYAAGVTTTTSNLTGKSCRDLVNMAHPPAANQTGWFWDQPTDGAHRQCYLLDPNALSGTAVTHAVATYDPSQNGWGINVTYRDDEFVRQIARPYVNKQVAIVVDNQVISDPVINSGITGSAIRLSGDFTAAQAQALAIMLRSGPLPSALRPA